MVVLPPGTQPSLIVPGVRVSRHWFVLVPSPRVSNELLQVDLFLEGFKLVLSLV